MMGLIPTLLPLLRNPWILLVIACAVGAGGTTFYRAKYHAVLAQQERALAEAQQKADALANELIIAQAAAMAANERTVTVYRDRIIHAPQTSTCGPTMRDAARGVRDLLGQPDAQRGAPAGLH